MRWIEPCAGAAAAALYLVDRLQPPVAWRGGKRRYAVAVSDVFGVHPGDLEHIELWDPGSWGWVWPVLLDPDQREEVLDLLCIAWEHADDAESLWRDVAEEPPNQGLSRVARWLILQAGNFHGREVHERDGRWVTHGYARPSEGALSRSGSCWSIERLVHRLHALQRWTVPTTVRHRALLGEHAAELGPGDLVYLDPVYQGTSGYAHDLERGELLLFAAQARAHGAHVVISEAEPLDLPGWHHVDITNEGRKGAGPEWLTCSRPPVRLPASVQQLSLL